MTPKFTMSKKEDSRVIPLEGIKENVSYLIQPSILKVIFGMLMFFEEIW